MFRIFLLAFVFLAAASGGMYFTKPDMRSPVPVLYWVTDAYPERREQVDGFHRWLIKNGHVTAEGKPICELRIDSSNRDTSKLLIQGVTGVCGDLLDQTGMGIHYLQQAGLLYDVTDDAKALGFGAEHTYAVLKPELVIEGRQYAYPRQAYAYMYVVNRDTFRKYGLPSPPLRWTLEQFEEMGKRFVAAANPPGALRRAFFANEVRAICLWRSLGASELNETMTRCTLNDPRYVRTLELLHKWAYIDHILPTATDLSSVASQSETQFGDSRIQMFATGDYAMIGMGRQALPVLRRYGRIDLGVAEPPHGGFPTTYAAGSSTAIYAGSKHPELARYFLQYSTSWDFNMEMVRNGDGVPPDPRAAQTQELLRPTDYPNEWGCHEAFTKAMTDIGIGDTFSPYVLTTSLWSLEAEARESFMAGLYTAEEAARRVSQRIDAEIRRTLAANPKLQERYKKELAVQAKIDELRSRGEPVPLAWISNPFHRRYYQFKGWAQP